MLHTSACGQIKFQQMRVQCSSTSAERRWSWLVSVLVNKCDSASCSCTLFYSVTAETSAADTQWILFSLEVMTEIQHWVGEVRYRNKIKNNAFFLSKNFYVSVGNMPVHNTNQTFVDYSYLFSKTWKCRFLDWMQQFFRWFTFLNNIWILIVIEIILMKLNAVTVQLWLKCQHQDSLLLKLDPQL